MDLLNSSPEVEGHQELFYPYPRRAPPKAGCNDYLRYVETPPRIKIRPFAVFKYLDGLYQRDCSVGFKLMYSHMRSYPEILWYIGNRKINVIHLIRANALDVLISEAVAAVTGTSHNVRSNQQDKIPAVKLNPRKVLRQLKRLDSKIRWARRLLEFAHTPVIEITYEELRQDPAALNRLLDFLNVPLMKELPESSLTKRTNRDHPEVIDNYEEIRSILSDSPFAAMLR
jgi:hypothetical protein